MNTANLPNEGFCRLNCLKEAIGLSKSKIYQMVAAGEFPKPRKIGRASLWPVEEVRAWIDRTARQGG